MAWGLYSSFLRRWAYNSVGWSFSNWALASHFSYVCVSQLGSWGEFVVSISLSSFSLFLPFLFRAGYYLLVMMITLQKSKSVFHTRLDFRKCVMLYSFPFPSFLYFNPSHSHPVNSFVSPFFFRWIGFVCWRQAPIFVFPVFCFFPSHSIGFPLPPSPITPAPNHHIATSSRNRSHDFLCLFIIFPFLSYFP